jgi:hypothetical protein
VDALVDGIALDEIVLQYAVGPLAELRATLTLYSVTDGDDDVEIKVINIICFSISN